MFFFSKSSFTPPVLSSEDTPREKVNIKRNKQTDKPRLDGIKRIYRFFATFGHFIISSPELSIHESHTEKFFPVFT